MYTDIPSVTRCCFCAPLRYGLLVWAYIKLVLSIILLAGFLLFLSGMIFFIFFSTNAYFFLAIFILSIILMVFDIIFNFVLIVGVHKKHTTLLRLYYRYGLAYVVIMIIFVLLIVGLVVKTSRDPFQDADLWHNIGVCTSGVITLLILHSYLLLLIRSEILKLKGNAQFRFENHAADPKCFMQPPDFSIDTNKVKEAEAIKTSP